MLKSKAIDFPAYLKTIAINKRNYPKLLIQYSSSEADKPGQDILDRLNQYRPNQDI